MRNTPTYVMVAGSEAGPLWPTICARSGNDSHEHVSAVCSTNIELKLILALSDTTQQQRRILSRVVRTASKILGCERRSIEDLYGDRVTKRARGIISGEHHPAHHLFQMMRSDDRFRSIRTKPIGLLNLFIIQRTMNALINE